MYNLIMSYEYSDDLPAEAKARYGNKLLLCGLDICPFKFEADKWSNDPKEWPDFEYPNMYHYLIKHPRKLATEF